MKINGPNHMNFNPYKQQLQKQADVQKASLRSDELQISKEALKLQEQGKPSEKRAAMVQDIKQRVENGDYQLDIEKTASKMIDFWRK